MKLGILTAPFAETSLADVADWSASAGFEALEIACWPSASGEKRRYAGTSHIAVEEISKAEAADIADCGRRQGACPFPASAITPTRCIPTPRTARP